MENVRIKSCIPKLSLFYFSLLDTTCITEMSVMMACWKQNDFSDTACAKEIQMFYDCVARAEVIKANLVFFRASGRKGREALSHICVPTISVP